MHDYHLANMSKQARENWLSMIIGLSPNLCIVPNSGDNAGVILIEWWAKEHEDLKLDQAEVKARLEAEGVTVLFISSGYRHWIDPENPTAHLLYISATLRGRSSLTPAAFEERGESNPRIAMYGY